MNAHDESAVERYHHTGADQNAALNDLIVRYHPLVANIASRYRDRGEERDDLEQAGLIGLLHAVDRFDPGRDVPFIAFAIAAITGHIKRHFRDHGWQMRVPRSTKDALTAFRRADHHLTHVLGRRPRVTEVAAHLDVPAERIVELVRAQDAYRATSLHERIDVDDDGTATEDPELERVETRLDLARALSTLPHRDQALLHMRFVEDLTQAQIASRLAISQMQVSRILARVLIELRDHHALVHPSPRAEPTGQPAAAPNVTGSGSTETDCPRGSTR